MMTIDKAAAMVRALQNMTVVNGREELLEYVALALTEREFDELCVDFNVEPHTEAHLCPSGLLLIHGMPVLIRTMK
jgi:hypothetical protein